LGASRDASSLGNTLNTNSSTTQVEQNVSNTEDQNLPADRTASITGTIPAASNTDQDRQPPAKSVKKM
jgi:hypothetical protein